MCGDQHSKGERNVGTVRIYKDALKKEKMEKAFETDDIKWVTMKVQNSYENS